MIDTTDPRSLVERLLNLDSHPESAPKQAADALTAALDEIATLRTEKHDDAEAIDVPLDMLEEMVMAFDTHVDLPDRNCSCHINPPCGDCVDYSFARDALSDAREALKGSDQ